MIPKDNNVIDLSKRRRAKEAAKKTVKKAKATAEAPIVDMTERRNEQIKQERRQVKRTILTEFIGAFAVVPQKGLMRVALYDISENGLAFDMETETGKFVKGEELAMRVYLNQVTYFPFVVKVRNVRAVPEEDCYRHGVDFVKGSLNNEALTHFVKFIETVSASLERDSGDVMVSNLKD
ncbi:MAG: PilZ domain-containing protein [Bdellovibrionaceae bacterium]|nr:PilZ domain-containing protein [Bdellovibrionales bacterium]MCB9086620.1 PilZ domain-containing protein [Pseudobdellovibrionaceae bacterium]